MGKHFCIECGNKNGWFKLCCSDCKEIICYQCIISLAYENYCVLCSLDRITKRKKEMMKRFHCADCGGKITDVRSLFCPFCGNNIKIKKK